MYELVSVMFPFSNNLEKGKPRPGYVISRPFGKYKQVIVAFVTTRLNEQLPTDILLDPAESYFSTTGLVKKSLIKLHRLGTFEPDVLKVGDGSIPKELIPDLKKKLLKVFQLK